MVKNFSKKNKDITKDAYQMMMGNSDKTLEEVGIDNVVDGLDSIQKKVPTEFKTVTLYDENKKDIKTKQFKTEDYARWGDDLRTVIWPN